jgi:outer membrane protein assembly factor BamB
VTPSFRRTVTVALFAMSIASVAWGDDWPQWRGPHRDGTSKETGLLQEWKPEGPALLWHVKDVGEGYSTPSVVGNRLYLLASRALNDEFVVARDTGSGAVVWTQRIGKVGNPDQRPSYPGARSTPTVEGDVLYALGSDGDLVCLDTAKGNIRWQKNLRNDFGGQPGQWAYSESPLVDGEVIVCTPGGADATIVALNKKSGEVMWKAAVEGGDAAGYASPIVVEADGVKQYVNMLAKGLIGVDASTGAFLWRYDRTAKGSPANMATPIARDGHVYSAAPRTGGALVKLVKDGTTFKAQEVYFDNKLPTAIGGAVLVGDQIYGTGQVMICADFMTGKVRWTDRGVGTGSVCFADGRLYVHGENGEVALVEATPDEYRERGRFTPPEQPGRGNSKAWAYPVVADGRLYIRDWTSLWCFDVRSK